MKEGKKFTLIELMLVVVIIGALAARVVPRLVGRSEEALKAAAKGDISSISSALELFELENGKFPTTSDGLNALMTKPSWAKKWNGPYLKKKPLDPWGNEYKYMCPGKSGPDFDLFSMGPDCREGGGDDIVNWE